MDHCPHRTRIKYCDLDSADTTGWWNAFTNKTVAGQKETCSGWDCQSREFLCRLTYSTHWGMPGGSLPVRPRLIGQGFCTPTFGVGHPSQASGPRQTGHEVNYKSTLNMSIFYCVCIGWCPHICCHLALGNPIEKIVNELACCVRCFEKLMYCPPSNWELSSL